MGRAQPLADRRVVRSSLTVHSLTVSVKDLMSAVPELQIVQAELALPGRMMAPFPETPQPGSGPPEVFSPLNSAISAAAVSSFPRRDGHSRRLFGAYHGDIEVALLLPAWDAFSRFGSGEGGRTVRKRLGPVIRGLVVLWRVVALGAVIIYGIHQGREDAGSQPRQRDHADTTTRAHRPQRRSQGASSISPLGLIDTWQGVGRGTRPFLARA
jgi:hypothetical protein